MSEHVRIYVEGVDDYSGVAYTQRREEIVRCRDCTYYDKYPNDEIYVCYRFNNEQPIVEPDGFCAWGRKG